MALWTTRHAPKSLSELVGNADTIASMQTWLTGWRASNDGPRAVLLSGPPGIGKTSAAMLVAEAAGFETIEFNASDVRSKKALQEHIASLTQTTSLRSFFGAAPKKRVLVMDEVDGMSAGDRGGIAELVQIIKTTRLPIICICNDVSERKMRTLKSKTLHLPFYKPPPQQLVRRIRVVAKREGIKLSNAAALQMIQTTSDVRQLINMLQFEGGAHLQACSTKNETRNAFSLARDFLDGDTFQSLGAMKAAESYFGDPSTVPLLVQENYVTTRPVGSGNVLDRLRRSADAISQADVLESRSRAHASFSYMPFHAVLSCATPGFYMHGRTGRIGFPQFLGKYSTTVKFTRISKELSSRLSVCPTTAVCDVLPMLATTLSLPLSTPEGIDMVIDRMIHYDLSRENWNEIAELVGNARGLRIVPGKVKGVFTRRFNKRIGKSVRQITKRKRKPKPAPSNKRQKPLD